ncbi:Protein SPIRRIG [Vitis vinifera]|uniref:Protein SPIRRIG n=1 Tax=Vitis vinifera TaxID=29760 RepID=A0A438F406_VITVI|nr:Protein SPIRRIG [Vitis vinifera]
MQIEGSVVHIMKALASHPSAAQSLIEDDSLQLLFQMVANGSLTVFSQYKDGLIPLHTIQLHRHAMQILGLLLVNDNGSTAKYIHKHHLIKVLLMAVKGFNPDSGDSAYTVGIVDLLLECVELSYRPEAGGIKLREDIHNAHGYQFLVQFALLLSTMPNYQGIQSTHSNSSSEQNSVSAGPAESAGSAGSRGFKSSHTKAIGHGRSRTSSSDRIGDEIWEKDNYKVKDLEAVQMLQDIFLKANSRELQAEVLNRMFKIFSGHLENYKLCQQLRTVPLLILNMDGFPPSLQEIILKILEYAVTVVNCIPEQELLSLCCLLQQPITSELKHTILSFFVKLLSFDQQYKKVLREVGVLEVLLDDLKQHKFLLGADQHNGNPDQLERNPAPAASRNTLTGPPGVLMFDYRRCYSGLSLNFFCQAHPEELGALVEVLKSGMVTSVSGSQYRLQNDAKCDILGSVWRILGVNSSAQRVFGEATGFSLLLTTLHSFQNNEGHTDQSSLVIYVKVFTYLLRVVTAGVFDNAANRTKLHTIILSQTFHDLLCESGLLSVEWEKQVIQLLLELALEIVLPPPLTSELTTPSDMSETGSSTFVLATPSGSFNPDKERVYNAGAVRVLIRSLLLFTPKVQLEVLNIIDKLARAGPYNQENLTSVGCVELLLEIIHPFLLGSSPLLSYALKIVEVLGAYRLSTSELRVLIRYILQMRLKSSGHILVSMMERLILMEDLAFESVPLAPFVEMDMSRIGHASVQVSLGARSWPPAAGYSFVCWFQYRNFLTSLSKETDSSKAGPSKRQSTSGKQQHGGHVLRIFSVGPVENGNAFYAELYLQEDGVLTLATSNSSSLSFSGLELEEDRWHHLAVVHSKPNALAGLFQASVAHVYLNGKLRHTGKLGYSPSPVGKSLQVTIGTPVTCARVSGSSWKLRCCYLFEEVLTSGCICFMYILGRGYRGLFQDTDLLRFVPNQSCGGGSMAILDSLDAESPLASNVQRLDSASKLGNSKADGKALRASGALSMLNLVDPMSAAASPIGGIPRFGRLHGDVYVCGQCVIGDSIRPVGGMAVVLALVEASETRDMLHMALTLLACALHQNPQNVKDMQTCRGYHLLSLFLHRRMSLFDMQSLEIFFQIAACEASFSEPKKLENTHNISLPAATIPEASIEDLNFSKFRDEFSSVGFHGDMDDFSAHKDSFSHISELENTDIPVETSNCIVLANADMVEHVLLDWTLWVKASISVQIALLGFLEHLVSMHCSCVRKLVVLLGVILEDGFLASELEHVVRFVIMTFDPPEPTPRRQIIRETMGKHIIVRNMLLEMLIDLQVTIHSEELLEQWHKIVSSKLITYFLDEAVHPTSMRWVMTLLGVCLASSPTFALKFRTSGGYQGLAQVLPSFYDSPDVYYILFCLMFGKPVYPRLPEVRMLDFHALMPSDGSYGELKFVELLESVIAMAKSTYDRLSMQSMLAHQTGNLSQVSAGLVAELVEGNSDMAGELQGEALMHKTYAARLMGGEASAPAAATSVLRFMVDLAKMCPPFSAICRRAEFLESCVDLYFSCVRAAYAVKMAKELSLRTEERNSNDCDDTCSSQNTFSSLPNEQEQSAKTSISVGSFPQGQVSTSSDDMSMPLNYIAGETSEVRITASQQESSKSMQEYVQAVQRLDGETVDQVSATSCSNEFSFSNNKGTPDPIHLTDSQSSASLLIPDSPILSEKSGSRIPLTPFSSSAIALSNFLGSASVNESKAHLVGTPSMESSASMSESDPSLDLKSSSQGSSATNTFFAVSPKLLLEWMILAMMKAAQVMETILETAPLYVDAESILVFQGLCLSRLMNFLERRLLRDDEEDEKKLDKSRWSSNLDALCTMIVDRVYMGAFPQPATVLKTLEFLLSMLQLANKDGRIEGAAPGKGLLSIARGSRQLDAYIQSIIKNTNRMILYCFLPSFLISIGEDDFLSRLGLQIEPKKKSSPNSSEEDTGIDICTVLQLLVAHRRIIFCPSNLDTELSRSLNCCLCINLIPLLCDQRRNAVNMAVDVVKYLLVHRRAALEDLLVSKLNQGQLLDVLHGGFDKLLTGSLSAFFEWLQTSEQIVNKVLEQCAAIMWVQHIAGSAKFHGVRMKGLEERRKRELGRRSRDIAKLDLRHWEQVNERRCALELVREAMSTELRVVRQDKYGWVLHAESEWQTYLQQLVHERGIFPMRKTSLTEDPEWQLCPIEGPYRMRKKLERCKLKIDTIQNVLDGQFESVEIELSREKNENGFEASDTDSESYFPLLDSGVKQIDDKYYDESFFKESDDIKDVASARSGWNDDRASSINEASLHSALEFGVKSSAISVPMSESIHGRSDTGSPRQSSSVKIEEGKGTEDKLDKELLDNGEYLIRPYLEPLEKIRFRYNCERVVGLDKHDGIFLIGELCLYVIENFYIDDTGCICEKECEDELSVIDQALGVKKDVNGGMDFQPKSTPSRGVTKAWVGGRAWAYNGGAWGKEKVCSSGNLPHAWNMWKLSSVHEILKRDYQLRPVAIEIFSMDGCNDLLVFHKKEREEVFKNLVAMNLPRNSMIVNFIKFIDANRLDTTISGSMKQESNEGSRLFKIMAKSFSKRWQNGEISNFQYLMHLNTLAGRGYSDLTQYPVFPWVLADYESENLDLSDPKAFRKLEKPMGCQTLEGEEEFKKRYESWDDPEVPKFHYGSHYSSAGIVLFYLLRLPPFSAENQKLQGGQFDHADRLFNSVRDTWLSAAGKGNTSDVKELIPEFFYMPEFLENRFNLDLGEKQSGEKVGDVVLPPWAKGSAREFIRKHREALESDFVSENLHHWIDLIFGYKQRGKAAEEAVNVFYHYTYEGSVDIDSVTDPSLKASILAQINHFGQTPKQLFLKPHVKRRSDRKFPPHPLKHNMHLVPHEIRKCSSSITQIVTFHDKVLVAGTNSLLKPITYTKNVSWGFPDRSLRFMSYDQDRLLSTHENLHGGNQIQCASASHDGQILVTGADDGLVSVWRINKDGPRNLQRLQLEKALCAHTAKITCLHVSQPYMLIVSASDDCTVILWDLSSLVFVRQLPQFPAPISAIYVNDLTGEIVTAAGVLLAVWSINGDGLAVINTSQLPSDSILSVTSCTFSDWLDTNWYVTGHQSGAVKVWKMVHCSDEGSSRSKSTNSGAAGLALGLKALEYRLVLQKVLKFHKHPVTALHLTTDLKQLLSGDSGGHLISWTLPDESLRASFNHG